MSAETLFEGALPLPGRDGALTFCACLTANQADGAKGTEQITAAGGN